MNATSVRAFVDTVFQQEALNFALTNRIPRTLATRFMGWFSKIEQPLVRDLSIATWKLFTDLDLEEASTTHFKSMHDCFTRQLKSGARPIDTDPQRLVSPCDGIVYGHGSVQDNQLVQAKGITYTLDELLLDPELVARYRNGTYVTLRLTSSMYHRFHAPYDCHVQHVTYVAGDTFNTNPIALARVDKLYVKNERAIVRTTTPGGHCITLVPVAAILVASIRLHFLNVLLHLGHPGPNEMPCDAHFEKGEEMGWYEHGSTILVFAPPGFSLCEGIGHGSVIKMGQALMALPS